jgi:hypothetical protein
MWELLSTFREGATIEPSPNHNRKVPDKQQRAV